jgi:hypothetical protein
LDITQDTIGILGIFGIGKDEHPETTILQSFPNVNLHRFTSGIIATSGSLWNHYESQSYDIFIDGEIFFRGEAVSEGINP